MKTKSLKEWKHPSPPPRHPRPGPPRLRKLKRYNKRDRILGKARAIWRNAFRGIFPMASISIRRP